MEDKQNSFKHILSKKSTHNLMYEKKTSSYGIELSARPMNIYIYIYIQNKPTPPQTLNGAGVIYHN